MKENCSPNDALNWEDEGLIVVIAGADDGIPEAKAELQRRELQLDTVSAKALDPALINIKWIEE
jgi:hypothetical protein